MKPKIACLVILTITVLVDCALAQSTFSRKNPYSQAEAPIPLTPAASRVESLPDLVIRQVVAVAGDDKKLRAHIVNVGDGDAGGCNLVLFYQSSGPTVRRGTYVAPIAKGKDLWVDVNNDNRLTAAASISLRVDDPNRVKESNELNNSYKFK